MSTSISHNTPLSILYQAAEHGSEPTKRGARSSSPTSFLGTTLQANTDSDVRKAGDTSVPGPSNSSPATRPSTHRHDSVVAPRLAPADPSPKRKASEMSASSGSPAATSDRKPDKKVVQPKPAVKRRKTKWQKPASQPIMRAAVWEIRFGRSRIVETANRYGIPLRTLRRYRDISKAGGTGYEEVDGKGVQFHFWYDKDGVRRPPLPPRTVCRFQPGFKYFMFEEDQSKSAKKTASKTPPGRGAALTAAALAADAAASSKKKKSAPKKAKRSASTSKRGHTLSLEARRADKVQNSLHQAYSSPMMHQAFVPHLGLPGQFPLGSQAPGLYPVNLAGSANLMMQPNSVVYGQGPTGANGAAAHYGTPAGNGNQLYLSVPFPMHSVLHPHSHVPLNLDPRLGAQAYAPVFQPQLRHQVQPGVMQHVPQQAQRMMMLHHGYPAQPQQGQTGAQ